MYDFVDSETLLIAVHAILRMTQIQKAFQTGNWSASNMEKGVVVLLIAFRHSSC